MTNIYIYLGIIIISSAFIIYKVAYNNNNINNQIFQRRLADGSIDNKENENYNILKILNNLDK